MSILQDGTGTGNRVKVNGNRLFTYAIAETQDLYSAQSGDAFNFNTGVIGLTSSTASGILYIKNNDTRELAIESIVVGIGTGTVTDTPVITLIKNPTTGTLISGASAVPMNSNRNFGSSKTFDGLAYKGAEGSTVTDGTNVGMFFQSTNGRLVASNIGLVLPQGSSIALTIDTNTSSGTTNVYAAMVGYLISPSFQG